MASLFAQVKYCISNKKNSVPVSWFKETFDTKNFDRKKKYLVFYSPGGLHTPKTLLENVSSIPVFETAQDVHKYDGEPHSYYRASVLATAASESKLAALLKEKRVPEYPARVLKDSSFEARQHNKQPSDAHQKNSGNKKSSSSASGTSTKKGKQEPNPEQKRQTSRSNLATLRNKLLSMDSNKPSGSKNSLEKIDCKSLESGSGSSCSQQDFQNKQVHQKSPDGQEKTKSEKKENLKNKRKDPTGGDPLKTDKPRPISPSVGRESPESTSDVGNALHGDSSESDYEPSKRDHTKKGRKTETIVSSSSGSEEDCFEVSEYVSDVHFSDLGGEPGSQRGHTKRGGQKKKRTSSTSSEAEDCYVSADKYSALKAALERKNAEIYHLQSANKRLRENQSDANDMIFSDSEPKEVKKIKVESEPKVKNFKIKSEPKVVESSKVLSGPKVVEDFKVESDVLNTDESQSMPFEGEKSNSEVPSEGAASTDGNDESLEAAIAKALTAASVVVSNDKIKDLAEFPPENIDGLNMRTHY